LAIWQLAIQLAISSWQLGTAKAYRSETSTQHSAVSPEQQRENSFDSGAAAYISTTPDNLKTTICEKTIRFCPEQEARAHSSLRPICGGLMTDRRAQWKKASTPRYARKDGSSELEDYGCAGIDVLDVIGQRCSSGQSEQGA